MISSLMRLSVWLSRSLLAVEVQSARPRALDRLRRKRSKSEVSFGVSSPSLLFFGTNE